MTTIQMTPATGWVAIFGNPLDGHRGEFSFWPLVGWMLSHDVTTTHVHLGTVSSQKVRVVGMNVDSDRKAVVPCEQDPRFLGYDQEIRLTLPAVRDYWRGVAEQWWDESQPGVGGTSP